MSKGDRIALVAPALLATAPAFAAAVGNVGEFTAPQLVATLAVFAAFGALVHSMCPIVVRGQSRQTVALVAAVVVAFLNLTPVDATHLGVAARNALIAATGALGATAIGWLLRPRGSRATGLPRGVGIFAVGVFGIGVAQVVLANLRLDRVLDASGTAEALQATLPAPADSARPRPDIYLLILDNLANARVQQDVYGRSNLPFQDSLESLGFLIPRETRSNYAWTSHSVASLLNLGHERGLEADLGSSSANRAVLYRLTQRNRAARWLREMGYTVYFQPSVGFAGTGELATPHVSYGPSGVHALAAAYARNELLRTAARRTLPGRLLARAGLLPDVYEPRLDALRSVASVAPLPSPKFVMAHSLVAHEWYVVDPTCRTLSGRALEQQQNGSGYVAAVECTERLVLASVRRILRQSATPPVIILQADHGTQSLRPPIAEPAERITPAQARERMGAFGAYYLPGVTAAELPETLTPVNVLRFVFSRYFGVRLDPLPDSSYYTAYERPFHFVNVTPYLATAPAPSMAGRPAAH